MLNRGLPLALATGFLAVGLSLPCQAQSVFRPAWTPGMYWVVESPRLVHQYDSFGNVINTLQDGYYYTRFQVLSVNSTPKGRTATIEIKYKINDNFTYDEMMDSFRIVVDMMQGEVHQYEWHGIRADGEPLDDVTRIPPWSRRGCGFPFRWPYRGLLPPTLHVLLPVFTFTGMPGQLGLQSMESEDFGNEFTQVVTPITGGARVELGFSAGPYPVSLVFRNGLPWYEAVLPDGTVINPIVETGMMEGSLRGGQDSAAGVRAPADKGSVSRSPKP